MQRYFEYTAKIEELRLGSAIEEKPRIDVSVGVLPRFLVPPKRS